MGVEWASVRPSVRPSVGPSVRLSTLSNMNISEISWQILIKFHLKHHWGVGLTALGFKPDPIRTWFPWQQIAPIVL